MRHIALLLATAAACASAQAGDSDRDTSLARPTVVAYRCPGSITVDGRLDEEGWRRPSVSAFTQKNPVEGAPPTFPTEVWVLYDDEAVYVGARLHDASPDSIVDRIGRRDADISGDEFYVGIDSYYDRRSGFFFGIYAGGSVKDGTLFNDEWDDNSWDGIWDAATTIDDSGWTAEMKIPYSQLRFTQQDKYVWGINFARQIQRLNEENYFVMVPKKESGWVSRFADLTGIEKITPPARFELLPYGVVSTRRNATSDPADPFHDGKSGSWNVGADLKAGLGSNLTLNGTINPDFGQVEVDPAVVNLTQFETFYEEKRPFFIEGSSLFEFGYGGANNNWGFNSGIPTFFYSRRIGRAPTGGVQQEGYVDYPDGTTILGAAKITGKVGDAWSLAGLSALTQREVATTQDYATGQRYEDVVEPLASYNIVRSQKEFESGKRAIGVIGTALARNLGEPYLESQFNSSALMGGIDGWTQTDSGGEYVLTGWTSFSRIAGSPERMVSVQRSSAHHFQRPDVTHVSVDSSATSLSGVAGRIALNKQKGNFRLHTALSTVSPGYDVNDMGFMSRTDNINGHLVLGYRWFEPDGFFRSKNFNVATFRNYTYGGDKVDEGYFLFLNGEFMNYWGMSGNFQYNPATLDRFGTRGGPMMMYTNRYGGYLETWSDSRASVSGYIGASAGRSESGGYRLTPYLGVTLKPAAGVQVRISPEFNRDVTIAQWVGNFEDATATATYGTRHVFGKIDMREVSASVRVDWTFTPKLSLQVYLQPLISVGTYSEFKELKAPHTYTFNHYGVDNGSTIAYDDSTATYTVDADGGAGPSEPLSFANPDFNLTSLRGNAVLRWEFLPGSTAYLVWTHSNYSDDDPGTLDYGRDVSKVFDTTSNYDDVFMLKIAYWIHP